MPVYGQPTEFNDRLSSLMSSIFCNSNDLYDGIDHPVKIPPSAAPSHIRNRRPLFTEAILQKASKLQELRSKTKPLVGESTTKRLSTILEIVLVADQQDSARCKLLSDLISRLFVEPEDHSNKTFLEVTAVRSYAIREDLTTARTSRSPLGGDSTGGIRRQRVFVGLGSALQGLCLYLCKEEALRLRLRHSRDTTRMSPSMPLSLTPAILAVVCVDPPLHLWKACGSYILEQMSLEGIPSFFVGYTEKDGEGVEHIHTGLAELLNGCKHHPRALALVAKDSATFLRRPSGSNATEKNRDFDACVWLARLIAKYAESVQRIRSPPRWQLGTMPRKDEGPGRSML